MQCEPHTHDAGDDNVIEHYQFHEVTEAEPGQSWTVFAAGPAQPGDWGYLNPETGHYSHYATVPYEPTYAAAFRALNPRTHR